MVDLMSLGPNQLAENTLGLVATNLQRLSDLLDLHGPLVWVEQEVAEYAPLAPIDRRSSREIAFGRIVKCALRTIVTAVDPPRQRCVKVAPQPEAFVGSWRSDTPR